MKRKSISIIQRDGCADMKIALIAHDEKKNEMVNFTIAYEHIFSQHTLFGTDTTGKRIIEETNLL